MWEEALWLVVDQKFHEKVSEQTQAVLIHREQELFSFCLEMMYNFLEKYAVIKFEKLKH